MNLSLVPIVPMASSVWAIAATLAGIGGACSAFERHGFAVAD